MNIPSNLKVALSGIRGHAPEVLTPELVYAFASALAHRMPPGPIVVGRDSRPSGIELKSAVISALSNAGREVLDIDLAPLPTTQIAILESAAAGGINITASHNPIEFNGLKLLGGDSLFIDQSTLNTILSFVREYAGGYATSEEESTDIQERAYNWHIDRLKEYVIEGDSLVVAVDAVNGAGSYIVPDLLRQMGCDVIEIATEAQKPFPHTPEPTPTNLEWTRERLKEHSYDLCVVVDPDADRLTLIDQNNSLLSEEVTLPLVLSELVSQGRTGSVVTNLSTSMMINDVARQHDIEVFRSPIGERNVIEKMQEVDAFFGGEGNGGVIDPQIHYGRDSLVGILYVINYLRRTQKPLSEIARSFDTYTMRKEKIGIDLGVTLGAYTKPLKEVFSDASLDTQDGLHFSWSDKWIHIRLSNTEPVLRIIGEAGSQKVLNELFNTATPILKEV
ncbi:MAG: hypothetical protein WDZ70_01345 [Candidatus Paceibacterota bacterium]